MRRLLVAGGGTGGHVYPLLAVLEALREADASVQVLYLGGSGGLEERLTGQHGVPFRGIPAGGLRGLGPRQTVTNVGKLTRGALQALGEVRRFRPDVLLVTGGYVSVPAAVAGWLLRRPVVVCLPDVAPGLAVRLLARLAVAVTVSFEEVTATLPAGKTVVTGYPLRPSFVRGDRATARQRLGVAPRERMLVVFGGSRGARSINDAVLDSLPGLLELGRVFHISGSNDYERVRRLAMGRDTCVDGRYRLYSYADHEMADLLWAADLVVARAGAATLAEFPAVGVPSIVVPYPYAGGHQMLNATYLYDRGAAVIVEDGDLRTRLLPTVRELLLEPARLAAMAQAARRLAKPAASQAVVDVLRRAAVGSGA